MTLADNYSELNDNMAEIGLSINEKLLFKSSDTVPITRANDSIMCLCKS